jgi:hypothetical protein
MCINLYWVISCTWWNVMMPTAVIHFATTPPQNPQNNHNNQPQASGGYIQQIAQPAVHASRNTHPNPTPITHTYTHTTGGYIQQIKQPAVHAFKPLAACLSGKPQEQEFVLADFAKMERPPLLLLAFRCVLGGCGCVGVCLWAGG